MALLIQRLPRPLCLQRYVLNLRSASNAAASSASPAASQQTTAAAAAAAAASIVSSNIADSARLRVEHDAMTSKFINCMMKDGKKAASQKIYEDMLYRLKVAELAKVKSAAAAKKPGSSTEETTSTIDPLKVFVSAVEKVKPIIGTTAVRKGSSVMQIPTPLNDKRRQSLAIKWIIKAARARKGTPMAEALVEEVNAIHNNEGAALKKKIELHKAAEANRANVAR